MYSKYHEPTFYQPGLNPHILNKSESWFAPEHLKILPYQLFNRPVPDHLTESMLEIANRTPAQNATFLNTHGLPNLNAPLQVQNPVVTIAGAEPIRVDTTMLKVPCADLNVPKVQYAKGQTENQKQADSFIWDLRNVELIEHRPATPFNIFILVHENNLRGHKNHPRHFPMHNSCRTVARYQWELEAVMGSGRGGYGVGRVT
jgi:eukaryotic translation initiation factor 2C